MKKIYKIDKKWTMSILRDKLTTANNELEVATKKVEKLEMQLDYLEKVR